MLKITKNYVLDQNQKPIAVQIPISDFEQIEEIIKKLWFTNTNGRIGF